MDLFQLFDEVKAMKVLKVDSLQDGLRRNIEMLDRLGSETEAIYQAVHGLVQMEDQLKGLGGNAIRSFYQECHLPFLLFFQAFSKQYRQVLSEMEAALQSFEPDPSGCIVEQFLEGDLEQGLTLIGQLTESLTDEANAIMDRVSDIVALPHLDDSSVQQGVTLSKRKRDDTLSQLHEFDATRTYALNPVEMDLYTMYMWLADLEGQFQAGVSDINFQSSQWNILTFRSGIRTELFPKVYMNPNDVWLDEQEKLIGTKITAATFLALEGKKVNTVEENLDGNVKYHMYENGLLIKESMAGKTVQYEVVSKIEYKEEEIVQVDKPKENKLLDSFQFILDIAGLVPGIGEAADGLNGVIYTARGDNLNAALSFGAMIPFAGWASTGGKLAMKGNDLNKARNVVSTEKMESIYSPIYQDVVNSPLGKTQNQLNLLTYNPYPLGTPNTFTYNMPSAKTAPINKDINVNVETKNVDIGKKGPEKRPSWRQSEIDVEKDFPDYNAQKSFKDGIEVPYGEKGSSRPDLYQTGHSIEVKNYKITTSSGRSRLVNNVSKQVEKRISDLPDGTKQSVIIDIRGQDVSDEILEGLYEKIMNKTNGNVDIRFKTN